jgi:hypothetical protein
VRSAEGKLTRLQLLGTYLVRYIALGVHPLMANMRAGLTAGVLTFPLVRLPCLGHPTAQRMW